MISGSMPRALSRINVRDALFETMAANPSIVVGMRDEEYRSVLTVSPGPS